MHKLRIILSFLVFSVATLAVAQGMTVHVNNGDKIQVKAAETDSITFSTEELFKTKYPTDAVHDTIRVIKHDTIKVVQHDTILVLRDSKKELKPYTSVTATSVAQYDMAKWDIPAGNYSGITWLGDNRYAIVSDKQTADGWQEVSIDFTQDGKIDKMQYVAQHFQSGTAGSARDAEGIALFTPKNTLFISAESDQQILEVNDEGSPTGRHLDIPAEMAIGKIYGNYGFEALTYGATTHRFWTTTENQLPQDGAAVGYNNVDAARLRILSFNDELSCVGHYAYATDVPTVSNSPKLYAFGVPALTVMDDGSLLVLEREFYVAENYIGSYVRNKLYRTVPLLGRQVTFSDKLSELDSSYFLKKTLLADFSTKLNITQQNIANYEGMCLAPKLPNGKIPLIMVSDSQDNYGNSLFHLKDYIRVFLVDVTE